MLSRAGRAPGRGCPPTAIREPAVHEAIGGNNMHRTRPMRARRFLPPLALALALLGMLVPRALADTTTKPYAVDVTAHNVSAGSTQTFVATLTNETGTQQLGSANLTVPDGFTIVSTGTPTPAGTATVVGDVVQLRGLAAPAGSTVSVSIVAIAPCPPGIYAWSVIAKQANNFSGDPGNDLTFDAANSNLNTTLGGTCRLGFGFLTQPADAQVNTNITTQRYGPAGPPIQVEVLDADGTLITSSTAPVSLS